MQTSQRLAIEDAVWWPDMGHERKTCRLRDRRPRRRVGVDTIIADRRANEAFASVKQVNQNYRTGRAQGRRGPGAANGDGAVLVATRVSLICSGTEKQLIDLAKASLAGKAAARPDLVRRVVAMCGATA